MDKGISKALLAIVATAVIACGSTGAGAAGRIESGRAGGDAYLMADDTFGVTKAQGAGAGAQGALSDPAWGPQLQP